MRRDRILVVDDNPANLKLVRVLLASEGYEVETAPDAEQALPMLERTRPALILMDVQLPGMSGLELTRILKGRDDTRDIPIIALTAYAMKADEESALAAGCDGFVAKPIDTRSLGPILQSYLASAGGGSQR